MFMWAFLHRSKNPELAMDKVPYPHHDAMRADTLQRRTSCVNLISGVPFRASRKQNGVTGEMANPSSKLQSWWRKEIHHSSHRPGEFRSIFEMKSIFVSHSKTLTLVISEPLAEVQISSPVSLSISASININHGPHHNLIERSQPPRTPRQTRPLQHPQALPQSPLATPSTSQQKRQTNHLRSLAPRIRLAACHAKQLGLLHASRTRQRKWHRHSASYYKSRSRQYSTASGPACAGAESDASRGSCDEWQLGCAGSSAGEHECYLYEY
jgi:hypothetical protein